MMFPLFWKRNGWGAWHLWGALIMVAAGFAVTYQAWADIAINAWSDEEDHHVFLVPLVAAWLVWVRRERFRFCEPRGTEIGPLILIVGAIVSLIGYYGAGRLFDQIGISFLGDAVGAVIGKGPKESLFHGGAVIVVVGCLISVVGRDVLLRFLPAFVVLVFLIPVPKSLRLELAIPLQGFQAQITEFVFTVAGSEINRQGNSLLINGQPVAIAEACNGLRMVFALFLVSYAFAYGMPLKNWVRVVVVAMSPVSAMVCNVIRMIPTVWMFGRADEPFFGMSGDQAAHVFHDYAGWPMLIIAFLILLGIMKALKWAQVSISPYTLARD